MNHGRVFFSLSFFFPRGVESLSIAASESISSVGTGGAAKGEESGGPTRPSVVDWTSPKNNRFLAPRNIQFVL